jgi:O-antigen/teichoic acid export membrane protein
VPGARLRLSDRPPPTLICCHDLPSYPAIEPSVPDGHRMTRVEDGPSRKSTIAGRQAASVGLASIASAAAGYLVIWFVPRVLNKADNAEFLAFWSALFLLFGILGGLQTEIIRHVSAQGVDPGRGHESAKDYKTVPLFVVVSGIAGCVALLLVLSSFLWGPAVLGPNWLVLVIVLAIASVAFSVHAALAGVLSGRNHWGKFSALVASESTFRLFLVLIVGLLAGSTIGLAAAAGAGAFAWVLVSVFSPPVRAAFGQPLDVPIGEFARKVGHASVSTAASATLVVGFPILYRITTPPDVYMTSAPLLLAILLTRAPLMVPLGTFQNVAIAHFVRHRNRGLWALRPIAFSIAAVAAAGAVAAYFLGPWLMVLLFGPEYHVAPSVLAGLTVAAAGLALLTMTGGMCVALNRHRVSSTGWVSASAVSLLILVMPLNADVRAVISLLVGPLIGVLIHTLTLSRAQVVAASS